MVYVPDIINYKPFYIQTDVDALAIDTTTWGLVAKSNPYPVLPTPKEVYKNEWLDEDGDDEYNAQMFYESMEFEVTFYVKAYDIPGATAEQVVRTQITEFFNKIRSGEFKIFDSYTGIGRRKVRYAGVSEEEFKKRIVSSGDWARAIFTAKFKANDPITHMTIKNGKIVEV